MGTSSHLFVFDVVVDLLLVVEVVEDEEVLFFVVEVLALLELLKVEWVVELPVVVF